MRHGYTVAHVASWFVGNRPFLGLEAFISQDLQIDSSRQRTVDVVLTAVPCPEEEVFTSPPYLCVEVLSLEDTSGEVHDGLDDLLRFGVSNIWVIDPRKPQGWSVTANGWEVANDGIMRTSDQRVAMPLKDVVLA
jgi:Uma2 family endonuclease